MAPGRRGRPPALPIEFIREQGWEDYAEGRSIGNRKDKVFTKIILVIFVILGFSTHSAVDLHEFTKKLGILSILSRSMWAV